MTEKNNHLYTDNTERLQIPYTEYVELIEKAEEGQRCLKIKEQVIANLTNALGDSQSRQKNVSEPIAPKQETPPEKNDADSQPGKAADEPAEPTPAPAAEDEKKENPAAQESNAPKQAVLDAPPLKKDIAAHFNNADGSGRLLNIFKQYYTCMNESCGGTVRVTIKDGISSIWNYDAWEEIAFVDIHEGRLRIGVNARYTEALKSLDLCEVPRLLARQHKLVCVQVDDLNQAILDVLVTAFDEVGTKA